MICVHRVNAPKFPLSPNDNGRDFIIHHPSEIHGYDDGKLLLAIVTRANDSLV